MRQAGATSPHLTDRSPLNKLRWLALLCVAVALLAYGVVGALRYREIRAETDVRLDRALRIATEQALKVFETNETMIDRVLDVIGDDGPDAIRIRERSLHEQLKAMSRDKPQIHSIWVHGPDGRTLASDRLFPAPADHGVGDRTYFKQQQQQRGGLVISERFVSRVIGTPFFDMSKARRAADGSFAGIVSVRLLPDYFEKFHADLIADEPGLAVTMLRDDGTIFTRWPAIAGAPDRLSPGSPVMSRIRAGQTTGTAHGVSSVDNRERLLSFGKVGRYPVYLGTGMDVRNITSRWLEEMGWLAAFGLPPLLGLFLAGRAALRRSEEALAAVQQLQDETQARQRVEEALLQAQKLEALGRLTGGVAHDFNNALMVISNNLFLIQHRHPAANSAPVASIGRAVDSATKLTRQLLAFSRRQPLAPEHIRLQDKLPALRDLLEPVLGRQIELSIDIEDATRSIRVDTAELELALINLAINARDAMPSNGQFRIAAHDAAGALPALLQPPMVVIEASDTGGGIEPGLLDKVFEPFFTTKPVGQGTGLGLSQIYGLCQRAGGLATIDSQPGAGTTVRLYFPAQSEPPALIPAEPPRARPPLDVSVLLVEDNELVGDALQTVLRTLGCEVTWLPSGDAAQSWLATQAQLPDVLLSDVVMPGSVDGLKLAQFVGAQYPGIAIVLMTGYAADLDAIAADGFDIISKPCSADRLATTIERATASRPRGQTPARRQQAG